MRLGARVPHRPQPADAAVGEDVQPDVRDGRVRAMPVGEEAPRRRRRASSRAAAAPTPCWRSRSVIRADGASMRLERAAIGVVALEVAGVDLDDGRACRARRAGPGSSRGPGPRLRRVSQPPPMFGRPARQEQVVHRPEERVRAGEREPAVGDRREIDAAPRRRARASRRRARPAPSSRGCTRPKTRKRATPPSGKMLRRTWRDHAAGARREQVLRVGPQRRLRQQLGPLGVRRSVVERRVRAARRALDRRERRVVADEVVRVDVEADAPRPARPAPARTSRSRARACGGSPSRPSTCRGR